MSPLDLLLLVVAAVLVPLAYLLPWPHDDRLVVKPQNNTRTEYPNVSQVVGLWREATEVAEAVPKSMLGARLEYFADRIQRKVRPGPPFRVLDVGCGSGRLSLELASLENFTVDCLDPSLEALAHAEAAARKRQVENLKFRFAAVYFIPFEDHTYDAVIMNDVIEYLLDLPSAMLEVARILRPGGMLFFSCLDRSLQSYLFGLTWPQYTARAFGGGDRSLDWRMLVQPEELNLTLTVTGAFRQINIEGLHPPSPLFMGPSAALGNWSVGPLGFSSMYYIGHAVKVYVPKRTLLPGFWKPGDRCEVLVGAGPHAGTWIHCGVVENGTKADTYNVVIGTDKVKDIHAVSLRKLKDEPNATMEKYEEGDVCEVALDMNHSAWGRCIVLNNHTDNETGKPVEWQYDIRFNGRLKQRQPAYSLRKVPGLVQSYEIDEWAEVLWEGSTKKGDWLPCRVKAHGDVRNFYQLHIPSKPGGQFSWPVHASKMRKILKYEVGEIAAVRGGVNRSEWFRCTVTARTEGGVIYPEYNVSISGAGSFTRVPSKGLRKLASMLTFGVGEQVEILAMRGAMKGSWVRGNITALDGADGSYNVSVRTRTGQTELSGIRFEVVRALNGTELKENAVITAWRTVIDSAASGAGTKPARAAAPDAAGSSAGKAPSQEL